MPPRWSVFIIPAGLILMAGLLFAANNNSMSAYYDGQLVNMNVMELPPAAAEEIVAKNPGLNLVYEAEGCEPGGEEFVMVLAAIQGDDINPLWREIKIQFNAGFECHQFTSEEEIRAAARAGEVTLVVTNEVYRCSVIGPKKH